MITMITSAARTAGPPSSANGRHSGHPFGTKIMISSHESDVSLQAENEEARVVLSFTHFGKNVMFSKVLHTTEATKLICWCVLRNVVGNHILYNC
jgi:hypothetical protein